MSKQQPPSASHHTEWKHTKLHGRARKNFQIF